VSLHYPLDGGQRRQVLAQAQGAQGALDRPRPTQAHGLVAQAVPRLDNQSPDTRRARLGRVARPARVTAEPCSALVVEPLLPFAQPSSAPVNCCENDFVRRALQAQANRLAAQSELVLVVHACSFLEKAWLTGDLQIDTPAQFTMS